ncbi:MAG TPA: pilus assembly protein PilM, partial [Terrimicrobiaceae bacterium]
AIKADQLDEINASVNKGGLRGSVVDVAPMALSNAFRYNYSELSGCSLLIDIGARTTNLIFVEGKRVFSRSIPVGGSTISASIAKEFRQDITLCERLKIDKGFVSLGGSYADPDDPNEAKISKIIRNTMTRLHAEIARSISFYRQNQSGTAPIRALLCGGTVTLPYMEEFFGEKLQMPIEHFNSFRNVTVANQLIASQAEGKAHTMGEVVGCALRFLGNTPLEINVRPHSLVREQNLGKRKPLLVLAASCLLLAPAAWLLHFSYGASLIQQRLDSVNADVEKLETVAKRFDALQGETKRLQAVAGPLVLAVNERSSWAEILEELGSKLPSRFIWVTDIKPLSEGKPYVPSTGTPTSRSPAPPSAQQSDRSPRPAPQASPAIDALEISGLYLANPPNEKEARIIAEFVDRLQESKIFKIEEKNKAKVVIQRTTPDGQSWAYGYTIILPLTNPISLP